MSVLGSSPQRGVLAVPWVGARRQQRRQRVFVAPRGSVAEGRAVLVLRVGAGLWAERRAGSGGWATRSRGTSKVLPGARGEIFCYSRRQATRPSAEATNRALSNKRKAGS